MSLPVNLYYRTETGKLINLRNAREPNLELSWDEHGDNLANFQICDWADRLPALSTPVWAVDPTYGVCWSGYAGQPRPGGFFKNPSKVTSRGWRYSLIEDAWKESKKWTAGTPLVNIVFEALALAHNITGGIPLPGGLTTTQLPEDSAEFKNQTPENAFEFVKNVFSYLSTPLIWQIKNNPLTPFADQPSLEMKFQDTAPRYKVRLTKNDNFDPGFDGDIVWNAASVAYADGLVLEDTAAQPYTVIPRFRYKRVTADADIKGTTTAQALVNALISRNNTLRPTTTILELHCDTKVQADYPAAPSTVANWPHHLIRPHFGLRILNSTAGWGQYKNVQDWYIIDVKHNFTTGMTTLTLGDPVIYEAFKLLQSYITNRAQVGIDSSIVNQPLRDSDIVPVYGPTGDGSLPAMTGEGSPIFDLDPTGDLASLTDHTKPTLRYGAGIDPRIQVDYGVSVNFGREADSIGIKGYIKVIPCRVLSWDLDHTPPPGSTTIPTDALEIKLHTVYPFTAGNLATIFATINISTGTGNTGTFIPTNFAQGGKIGVEVTVPSGVANSGFQLGVLGKKIFPDVGIND